MLTGTKTRATAILITLSAITTAGNAENEGNPELKRDLESHDTAVRAELEQFRQESSTAQQGIDAKLGNLAAQVARCNGAWSQKLPAGQRFDLVLNDKAVLDVETCLVWERSPRDIATSWKGAVTQCIARATGGRLGWHLPTVEEMSSLIDPSQVEPALPVGHPFLDILQGFYWSATTVIGTGDFAWAATFSGFGSGFPGQQDKESQAWVWCVRGGQGYDAP